VRLFDAFAAGVRAGYGKLPMVGFPGLPGRDGARMKMD
jgi:hypothetical protein